LHGRRALCLAPLAVLALVLSAPAFADEPEGWAYTLSREVMSPFCPGRTLAECPSSQADQLRLWIITQEAAGVTRAEVEQMLYERFGDEIRSVPQARGWGWAYYVVPIAAVLLGGTVVVASIRRLVRPQTATHAAALADPELERMLDEELSRG
jgi:cytochrome c-type biogenesis protein CcmH